jgi:hypothetical protein
MNSDGSSSDANPAVLVRLVLPLNPPTVVLHYEKPVVYRCKSDLPPPGLAVKAFWLECYWSGRLLGLVYKPRPAPRLYTPHR